MLSKKILLGLLPGLGLAVAALPAGAESLQVQCPAYTTLHPDPNAQTTLDAISAAGPGSSYASVYPGQLMCQEISGTDGFATMADGTQMYIFGFGALSGRTDIQAGQPGTQTAFTFANDASDANGGAYEPADMMNKGVLDANAPAPMIAIDEDDELFLTLSNVGQIMRPDLFEQHTVHFHGYPNASAFYDGVPDASIAINIAGSFTYYYTAPDAGTYFWHCHITPPEHLQMGMEGQLFVRPRQNRLAVGADLRDSLVAANVKSARPNGNADNWGGTRCNDILCSGQTPAPPAAANQADAPKHVAGAHYAYNDGDGSTRYDVEYPIQLMGFDPNFHYVSMTFNPEAFVDMKDKYFLMNGRGYPDTVNEQPISTLGADGATRVSQPLPSLIRINKTAGQKRALLRISELNITEMHTLATVGVLMTVIGWNARMLRDMAGHNLAYQTNSITMGGGESADVILDVTDIPTGTYFLYTTNLDHLSNDAENFGGMMTEIRVE